MELVGHESAITSRTALFRFSSFLFYYFACASFSWPQKSYLLVRRGTSVIDESYYLDVYRLRPVRPLWQRFRVLKRGRLGGKEVGDSFRYHQRRLHRHAIIETCALLYDGRGFDNSRAEDRAQYSAPFQVYLYIRSSPA